MWSQNTATWQKRRRRDAHPLSGGMATFLIKAQTLHRTGSWSILHRLCVWREKGWSARIGVNQLEQLYSISLPIFFSENRTRTTNHTVDLLFCSGLLLVLFRSSSWCWCSTASPAVHCYVAVWQVNWLDNGGVLRRGIKHKEREKGKHTHTTSTSSKK